MKKITAFFSTIFLFAQLTNAQINWYVGPNGTDAPGNGTTPNTPFKTITYACNSLTPGDTCFVRGGVYTNTSYGTHQVWNQEITANINNVDGTPGNYITFKPYQNEHPVLKGDGVFIVRIRNSEYIRFEGFEIYGEVENIPMDSAVWYQFQYRLVGSNVTEFRVPFGTPETEIDTFMHLPVLTNTIRPSWTSCIGFLAQNSHHIDILDNYCHHLPGTGMRVFQGDYINFIGNEVHDCSRRGAVGNHGVVFHSSKSIDNQDNVKIVIAKNHVHHNYNEVYSWSELKSFITTEIDEGKGISMQKNDGGAGGWVHGIMRIENNVCHHNGFSGIHINEGVRMKIINNTCYENYWTGHGTNVGISVQDGDQIDIRNNISVSNNAFGGFAMSVGNTTNLSVSHNFVQGTIDSDVDAVDVQTIFGDPLFTNPAMLDFTLQPTSNAIDTAQTSPAPDDDYFGNDRDATPDRGAIEYFEGQCNASTIVSGPEVACLGGSVTLNGGTGFTNYAWSNGGGSAANATFSNLTATTTFTVTVTNVNGCTATASKTVALAPTAFTINAPNTICSGTNLTLDAGAGGSAYLWNYNGGTGRTATFTNITSLRNFRVTVTSPAGCTSVGTKTVTISSKPDATITTPALGACIGGTAVASVPAVSGGTYNWTLTGGSIVGGQGTNAATGSFTTSGSKVFSVTVTNSAGCSATKTKAITAYAGPTLSAVTYTAGCGGASGEVNLSASAGLAPYNYAWSNAATTQDLVNIAAGAYTVTATDTRGCTKTGSYTVNAGTAPPNPVILGLAYACSPLRGTLTWRGPQGGSYELRYRPSTTTAWTDLGNIGNVFSYTVPGLLPNVNYYFSIRYVCPVSGFGIYVQRAGVSPNCALAAPNADRDELSEVSGEAFFKLLPNPATDRVKLVFENLETDAPAEISIFNAVGQAVLNRSVLALAGENVFEIEIGELPQGVYQVVLRAGEERFSESLVVLRK